MMPHIAYVRIVIVFFPKQNQGDNVIPPVLYRCSAAVAAKRLRTATLVFLSIPFIIIIIIISGDHS